MVECGKDIPEKDEILKRVVNPGGKKSLLFPLSFWHYRILPRWERDRKFDIFHDPDQIGCFFYGSDSGKVLTIHDLSALTHPETHPLERVKKHRYLLRKVLENTDKIVVPSRSTAEDVEEVLDVERDRIVTVYPGCDHLGGVKPISRSILFSKIGISQDDPFIILTVSTIEPRKEIPVIVEAFEMLSGASHDPARIYLVIVGERGWKSGGIVESIRKSPCRKNIIETGRVDNKVLVGLYENSSVFVCMSRKEGFGFPPLEAQYHGLPTVISKDRALQEISGEGSVSVDHGKKRDEVARNLSEAILSIRSSDELRMNLSEKGRINSGKYTVERFVRGIVEVYKGLIPKVDI